MRKSSVRIRKMSFMAVITVGLLLVVNPAYSKEIEVDRVIDLEGTTNTRDIGGYLTDDMRTIRAGQIIRSEKLSRLTADDFQKLEDIGVKTVIDLRTDREVEKSPTAWQGDNPPEIHHLPIFGDDSDWYRAQSRMMNKNRFSEEQSLGHMVEGYRMIAEVGSPAYSEVMDLVLDESNWPILIHCSAGKDRSGIAVALIQEALGVDRETIMEEYLLTNEVGHSQKKAELMARESKRYSRTGRGPSAEAWYPIVGVRAEMLEKFYASVDEEYGSMEAYLNEIGLDLEAREGLKASLTTEQPELAMEE